MVIDIASMRLNVEISQIGPPAEFDRTYLPVLFGASALLEQSLKRVRGRLHRQESSSHSDRIEDSSSSPCAPTASDRYRTGAPAVAEAAVVLPQRRRRRSGSSLPAKAVGAQSGRATGELAG